MMYDYMNKRTGLVSYYGAIMMAATLAFTAFAQEEAKYPPAVPEPTWAEVKYGDHDRNVMDIWKSESTESTPLVLVIHGGGWNTGSKEFVQRFVDVQTLLDAGISVAAINYRYIEHGRRDGLVPPVQAPLHDAARALQFLRLHAERFNVNKERIAAAGASAGGCSSLWLAYRDDMADPDSDDPVRRESTRLFCAAVIGAQTTLDPAVVKQWIPNARYGGHAFGYADFESFLLARNEIVDTIETYSPYSHVTADDPPTFLLYSMRPALAMPHDDPTHSANYGLKLKERCDLIGIECELLHPGIEGAAYTSTTQYLVHKLTRVP